MSRWKLPAVVAVVAGLAVGGVVVAASGGPPDDPAPRPAVGRKPAERDRPAWKERTVLDHSGWLVGSVAYSPDGKMLLVGGTNGNVVTYDAATWKQLWAARDGGSFTAVAYSPDGKTAVTTFADGVKLRDPSLGAVIHTLEQKGSEPVAVGIFPEITIDVEAGGRNVTNRMTTRQQKIIFGNAQTYFVKTWLKWPNVSTITSSTTPPDKQPADRYAIPLAVAPDGKRAVVTGPIDRDTGKNVLWAWSAGSGAGNQLLEGHKAPVTSAAWSADGTTIVTGDADGTAIVWDAETWTERNRVNLRKMRVSIRRGVGPDGREKPEPGVFDDPSRVVGVAVSADGSRVAAAVVHNVHGPDAKNYMECVFVWKAADPPEVPEPIWYPVSSGGPFRGYGSIAFSPDGKTLAAAFCNLTHLTRLGWLVGKVRVWELTPRK